MCLSIEQARLSTKKNALKTKFGIFICYYFKHLPPRPDRLDRASDLVVSTNFLSEEGQFGFKSNSYKKMLGG